MENNEFETGLLKMIAATQYSSLLMQTAQEMFGRSYFSLGTVEAAVADQQALAMLSRSFGSITPELLVAKKEEAAQAGFSSPKTQS